MLTNKIFMRKTKRGNILKVSQTQTRTYVKWGYEWTKLLCKTKFQIVREHYLREDIWCGSTVCQQCDHRSHDKVLSSNPVSLNPNFPFPHYLVLDTNVVLDQIDVFEEDVLCNIIVLHTVLNEVKHRSSAVYKKLRNIISDQSRNVYTFVNEHHK